MKKQNKISMSFFMLLIILSNFFISTISVFALSKGDVYNYIQDTNSTITKVENKINTSKQDINYQNNNSFKESVDYIGNIILDLKNNLNNQELILDKQILLCDLVNNYFPNKKDECNTYFSDSVAIDVNNISDITYDLSGQQVTFLTKEEIIDTIINNYLKLINDKIIDYNTNYDNKIISNQNNYLNTIKLINDTKDYIKTKINEINQFEQQELLINNNPNMFVNNENIYTLLNNNIDLLNNITNIKINNLSIITTNINNIKNDSDLLVTTFYNNNKNYIELGLDTSITDLNNSYNNLNSEINEWFINNNLDYDDFKNKNVNKYINKLDINLINNIKSIIEQNSNYNILMTSINNYLLRKASDTETINNLLLNINSKLETLNKDLALDTIDQIIKNIDLTKEDNIDLLYNLLELTDLTKENKFKIIDSKLNLYPISLKNTNNYNFFVDEDNLIITNLVGNINKEDFINNIDYLHRFVVIEQGNLLSKDTSIELYDKNDKLIITYKVIIQGDANSDSTIDEKDTSILKDNLLKGNTYTKEDLYKIDLNNDNTIDINDLVLLKNLINNQLFNGKTSIANIEIDKEYIENDICYNIKLLTDGNILGFSFDISTTNNIIFDKINYVSNKIEVNTINPSKIISIDNFSNNESIINICYKEKEDNYDSINFNLNNIIIILDTGEVININEISNVIAEKKKVELNDNSKENNNYIVFVNNEKDNNKIEENKKPIQEIEEPSEQEQEEQLLLSNVIKIVIIVLLGTLIIYYMNKNETEEILTENEKKESDQ